MSYPNPFLLRRDPYHENPFVVLGVDADANNAVIEDRARRREGVLERGIQPAPGLGLQPGDCITAAEALKNPVLRLAFDLMHFGGLNTGDNV
jgi:hypothetical protein